MTTGKTTVALTIGTFVGEVMSLLFNMLSRLVIALIPWLQSVILEPKKITSATAFTIPFYLS